MVRLEGGEVCGSFACAVVREHNHEQELRVVGVEVRARSSWKCPRLHARGRSLPKLPISVVVFAAGSLAFRRFKAEAGLSPVETRSITVFLPSGVVVFGHFFGADDVISSES